MVLCSRYKEYIQKMVVPAVEPLEGGVGVLLVVELGVHVAHLTPPTHHGNRITRSEIRKLAAQKGRIDSHKDH